eukprot:Plantae.Rhodophyta-Hildenbrandia_rubra.ctg16057.p1 GENE.Plantae.Rhodophyta-Hildenbrandia_rubra.ctg16057~~Plantae.Rhodophyta-Hildenbrandia_rubra.ctg16057.p1  ORF type:complete len:740 (-),score=101.53 Plantae.Rhodophyta-Hildenbrandia_rubra.ctg16057:1761-3890(-)
MIASLWNVRRALRGLFALYDVFLIWRDVDLELIHFAFRHLMPEARDADGKLVGNKNSRRKCSVWNLLLSSVLSDYEWPGDAPRVKYVRSFAGTIRSFPIFRLFGGGISGTCRNMLSYIHSNFFKHLYMNVYAADREARRAIVAVWVLWMVRRSLAIPNSFDPAIRIYKYPRAHQKLEKSHFEQYFGEGDLSSKIDQRLWEHFISQYNNKQLPEVEKVESGMSSGSSFVTETEHIGSISRWSPFEAALFRVATIWRRRSDNIRDASVVSKSEIEKQLSTLPTETTDDLSIARACQIAELEMHLPIWGRRFKPAIEELCSVLWLPFSYIPALSRWAKDPSTVSTSATEAIKAVQGLLPSDLGRLLAAIVLLIFLEVRKDTFALEPSSNYVSVEDLVVKEKEEAKDSETLIGRVGATVGAVHKYLRAPSMIEILGDAEQRDDFLYDEVKCFLKGIFGETWKKKLAKGHLDVVLRTALESFLKTLVETEMPKVGEDDQSPSVRYCLTPSHVFFHYLSGRIKDQSRYKWSKQSAEQAVYSHPQHWTRGAGGEMSLEYKEMSSDVTAVFRIIPTGAYSVTISFRFDNLFQHSSVWEEVLDPLHSVKVSIAVESPSKNSSDHRKDFEIEPIYLRVEDFLDLISIAPESEWIRLKCFNIVVGHEETNIVIRMKFSGPATHYVTSWITIGSFQLLPMTEDDFSIKPSCQLRSVRQLVE